jgi:hypothetical protein
MYSSLAESIPCNRFLGSLNVYKFGLRIKYEEIICNLMVTFNYLRFQLRNLIIKSLHKKIVRKGLLKYNLGTKKIVLTRIALAPFLEMIHQYLFERSNMGYVNIIQYKCSYVSYVYLGQRPPNSWT